MAALASSLGGLMILSACGGGGGGGVGVGFLDFAEGPGLASSLPAVPTESAQNAQYARPLAAPGGVDLVSMPAGAAAATTDPALAPRVYFVAPDGDDRWTGKVAETSADKSDGPLSTLAAAQTTVRRMLGEMASGRATRQPIRVQVLPGTFLLRTPLVFTEADSGTADAPVVYEARTPGTVTLSGGESLLPSAATDSQVVFRPPAQGTVDWRTSPQLFVEGRRAVLARHPNPGEYWFVRGKVSTAEESGLAAHDHRAFKPSQEAVRWISGLDASDRERAFVHLHHSWTTSLHRLQGVPSLQSLELFPAARWPFLHFGLSQRYYIENVRSALDAPGEWYGDDDAVTYLRRGGSDAGVLSAVLPVNDRLIVVRGNAAADRWVEHLQLRGFALQHTRLAIPPAGHIDPQAAVQVGAALEVDGARHLLIEQMQLSRLGGYGLWLRENVVDSVVRDNTFADLGAGGIRIGLDAQPSTDRHPTARNVLAGNTIIGTGQLLPGAVGIWLGQTWDNRVENNLVADTSYTGISVGWQWGYGAPSSGRNLVRGNLLYNIGQGKLADLGAIYTLGPSPGTVIERNVIREVRGYPGYGPRAGGAWGIYQDEGTGQTRTEDNIVLGTGSSGYHLHYGRDNIVRRNVFAGGDVAELSVSRTDPALTRLQVINNLFLPRSASPFEAFAAAPDAQFAGNLVGNALAAGVHPDTSNCADGCATTASRIVATGQPKDLALLDAPDTWAAAIAATVAAAGPVPDSRQELPMVAQTRPVVTLAPPVDWTVDVAGAAVGSQPAGLVYEPPGDLAAVHVVEQPGSPESSKCLRLNDHAGMPNRWDPHVFAWLNHDRGTSSADFALWIDEHTDFTHEWRDDAHPYRVGPSLRVSSAGIQVGRRMVAPVVVRGWTHFRVTAGLGAAAGPWRLEVTAPHGKVDLFDGLPLGTADWRALKWLGFVSEAHSESSLCLAKLSVASSLK